MSVVETTSITLREAYRLYLHDQPPVKKRTVDERNFALNHWERLTGNLPLPLPTGDADFDRQQHARFNAAMLRAQQQLATEVRPTTANKYFRRTLNPLFRRLSPQTFGNENGVGLIDRVYKFPLLAEDPNQPAPLSADEMARCYLACDFARWPVGSRRWKGFDIPPGDWWRAALVYLYNVGQRTGDWLSLRTDQVDLKQGTVRFQAEKTSGSKGSKTKPLHPVVVAHLELIWGERELVFPAPKTKTARMDAWKLIQRWAGVRPAPETGLQHYRIKDLRSTCGTELFAVSPGAAQEMLGHSSLETTRRYYANLSRHLDETARARPQPAAFLGQLPTPPVPPAPVPPPEPEPPAPRERPALRLFAG